MVIWNDFGLCPDVLKLKSANRSYNAQNKLVWRSPLALHVEPNHDGKRTFVMLLLQSTSVMKS